MDPSPTPTKPLLQLNGRGPSKDSGTASHDEAKNHKPAAMAPAPDATGGSGPVPPEDSITKDDLQAMKDMIGDIKKDPSLLFRLSSLPGGTHAAPAPQYGSGGRSTSTSANVFVDDDATDVSSLGMVSSSDHQGSYQHLYPPGNGEKYSQGGALSPNANVLQHGGNPNKFANATAAAARRTNHDAEIALRMQSLMAKRGLESQNRSGSASRSSSRGGGYMPARNYTAMSPSNNHAKSPAKLGGIGRGASGDAKSGNIQERVSDPLPLPLPSEADANARNSDPTPVSPSPEPHPQEDPPNVRPPKDQQRRMSKKLEGKKPPSTERRGGEGAKGGSNVRRGSKGDETKESTDSDSVALVLYEGENHVGPLPGEEKLAGNKLDFAASESALTVSPETSKGYLHFSAGGEEKKHDAAHEGTLTISSASRGGPNRYSNYQVRAAPQHPLPLRSSGSSASYYHSAVSKYAVEERSGGRSNGTVRRSGGGQPPPEEGGHRTVLSSSSVTNSSNGCGNRKAKPERRASQDSATSRASTSSKASASSKRSKSAVPRHVEERGAGSIRKPRSVSAQPIHAVGNDRDRQNRQSSSSSSSRRTQKTNHRSDPPEEAGADASERSAPLDRGSLIANLRAEQEQSLQYDQPSHEVAAAKSEKVRRRKSKKERADSPTQSVRSQRRHTAPAVKPRADSKDEMERMGGSARERMDHVSFDDTAENQRPPTGGDDLPQASSSGDLSLGRGLDQLAKKDPSARLRRRPSTESESGRSVISRLSHLRRKNRTPSKRSASSVGNAAYAGGQSSLYSLSHHSGEVHISGSNNSDSPNGSDHNASKSKGLVSRISHFSSPSPKMSSGRRRLTENFSSPSNDGLKQKRFPSEGDEIPGTSSLAVSSDSDKKNRTEHIPYIANEVESEHVSQGIELAIRSGEVPRLCDERGRCLFHPHIRLQKPKLFGGWKVLYQHCPDCAVEHMKKTQEKLRRSHESKKTKQREAKKRSHKKEKERGKREREKGRKKEDDRIIGKNIGDEDFTKEDEKARRRSRRHQHRSDKKEKRKEVDDEVPPPPPADATEEAAYAGQPESAATVQQGDDHRTDQFLNDMARKDNDIGEPNQRQRSAETTDQPPPPPAPEDFAPQTETSTALVPVDASTDIVDYAPKPKPKRVNGLPWSDYNGHSGRYTGEVNEQYLPHGKGEMVYDRGSVSAGIWYNGVLDTEGDPNLALVESSSTTGYGGITHEEYTPDIIPNYCIGDRGREEDMVIDGKKATSAAVSELRASDAAFVRRSDGSWTYAIVKDRTQGNNPTIRFKVNVRGSTKAFPTSQWGTYVRRIRKRGSGPDSGVDAGGKQPSLGDFLDSKNSSRNNARLSSSRSVAGNMTGNVSSDASVSSIHSAPMMNSSRHRSVDNLTTAKMKIRTRSRSKSRNRKNVTTLPLLFSSSMSVSEENDEGHDNDDWETASGSGYRLRGIDP